MEIYLQLRAKAGSKGLIIHLHEQVAVHRIDLQFPQSAEASLNAVANSQGH